jgi:SAM-dependent methyltransferase
MLEYKQYFQYLRKRSKLGLVYRKFWLYPKLNKQLKGRTLDVGCGIGDMLKFHANAVGVDINPEAVNFCSNQNLDARLMLPDILPFDDGSFDSVLLDNVLEHINAPSPLLNEVKRVLVKNGSLLIGVPCGEKGFNSDSDHKRFYDEKLLVTCLTDHGFILVKAFYAPFKFHWFNKKISQYCLYGVFKN